MIKHAFRLTAVFGAVGLCGCSVLVSIPSSDVETGAGGSIAGGGTSNAGDTTLTGGTQATAGTSANGASSSTAGTVSTGGVTSNNGTSATAGSPSTGVGGVTSMGGTAAAGGVTSAGGTEAPDASTVPGDSGTETRKMFIGNIPSSTNDVVRDGFATYWGQIVPENVGKWGVVQPNSKDQFDWSALDAMYKYANEHNIIFKQHNFFCGNQQPTWVKVDNVAAAGEAWVKAFCERYPKTKLIDVVNEPSHFTPGYVDGMGGLGATGYDWVITAYKWARKYCPNAILIINDFNIIEYDSHHDKFMAMMKAILAAGAPIDAIGAEGHDAYQKNTTRLMLRLDDLATTGLPVYITEYDINLAEDDLQLAALKEQVQAFWDDPNVKGLTYWGYAIDSNYSLWREHTNLVNLDGTFRPSMTWLQDFIKSH
jgi:endo-1,4-beta-xylanase